jgi:hypothetical protein
LQTQARELISGLNPADIDTFRALFDHILAAVSEGLCPLCFGPISDETARVPMLCSPCVMVWEAWPENSRRILGWESGLLLWWSAGWKAIFLQEGSDGATA